MGHPVFAEKADMCYQSIPDWKTCWHFDNLTLLVPLIVSLGALGYKGFKRGVSLSLIIG